MYVVYKLLPTGGWALCVVCSYVGTVYVCMAMPRSGECVRGYGLRIVLFVVGLGCVLVIPDRFVQVELGEYNNVEVGGECSEACGILWVFFCRSMVAK